MTAQFIAMEKAIEASELLEMVVETEAGAGARGLSVAGGGKGGLFVKDVLEDSPAARVLSLREGDQLLSARVYFDNIKYEDALQILRCAEPYRISFCLKRVVPSADVSRQPGATAFEVKGPKAKVAKLNIQSLPSLKRRRRTRRRRRREMGAEGLQEAEAHLAAGKPEGTPVDVEFAFPRFPRLRKARSAGEAAEASSGLWRKSSTRETMRRRLRFPRLKVKEAAAARAEGAEARLARGLPHVGLALKEAGRAGVGGSLFRLTTPFSTTQKLKEDVGPKVGLGFQAPQVELALPLPRAGAEKGSPRGGARGGAALSRGSGPTALEAGLELPAAEVAAPQVDLALALPQLECSAPQAAPKGEGSGTRVPRPGVSAEEAALKLPSRKAPALEVVLGEGRGKASAEQPRPGGPAPSLGLGPPAVALELPFPMGGKAGMESPGVSGRVPLVSLSQLGSEAQAGGAGRLPQVEVSVGKAEGPAVQLPGLAMSLRGQRPESREAAGVAGDGQVKSPEGRMPSLGPSAPRVCHVHLCKAMGEPASRSGRAKPTEAAEGAGLKFHMPQVSLPKFDLPVEAAPSSPPDQVKMPGLGGELGTKVGLSLPAGQGPGGPLPRGLEPEPSLCVEKPEAELAVPPALPGFPSAALPVLDLELPSVGVELRWARHEGGAFEQGPGLRVEIGLPAREGSPLEREPGRRRRSTEGPALAGVVAQIPKVSLAFGKGPAKAEGPKAAPEGARMQLPAVEIPHGTLLGEPLRFALSKLSLSGPTVRGKASPGVSAPGVGGAEAAGLGAKPKLRKFEISFPKAGRGDEAGDVRPAAGAAEGEAPEERPGGATGSKVKLPAVEVDLGRPPGPEGQPGGGGPPPELLQVQFREPKVSLLRLGDKGEEAEWGAPESGEVLLEGRQQGLDPSRVPEKDSTPSRLRRAPFGLLRRGVGAKGKKAPGSPKEKPKGLFGKMPQLKLSSPMFHGGGSEGRLPAPALDGAVLPQVELLPLGPGAGRGLIPEAGGLGVGIQLPPVEIAVPGSRAEGEVAESRGPSGPSIEVSSPALQLDIGLPGAGGDGGILQAAPGIEVAVRLPKVELVRPGRGEGAWTGASVQLLGEGGEGPVAGAAALGTTKVRLPKVGLSVPESWLREVHPEGPEATSMGLPRLGAPSVRAPELGLAVGLEWGGGAPKAAGDAPSAKGSKSEASDPAGEGTAGEDLPRVPQLELRPPQLGGGTEASDHGTRATEGWPKVPALGLGKLAREAGVGAEGGRFRPKLPSLGISCPGAEPGLDRQPLCPPAQEAAPALRTPQVALPDVGFSGTQRLGGGAQAAGATGPEGALEGLLRVPRIGILGAKGGVEGAASLRQRGNGGGGEPVGRRPGFEVPGLEISTPSLKAHLEYEVGGSLGGPLEGRKRTEGRVDTGRWPRVSIPRLALFLPRAGPEAPEGLAGQGAGAGGGLLALRKPEEEEEEEEGSAGLLERDGEGQAGPLKARPRAPFALALSRPKWGAEPRGEAEEAAPKLGSCKAEGAEVPLQDGAGRLGKIPLPQVELLSPSKGAGTDPELSLKLVRADEAQGEALRGPTIPAALRAAKFKPPRIALPGFRKHGGEPAPPAEGASWEAAGRFRFPKVALGARPQGAPGISGARRDQGEAGFRLPPFPAENGPEEGGPGGEETL